MNKAALLIGIDNYEAPLEPLSAAIQAAGNMADWAQHEGFEVHILDDSKEAVTSAAVMEILEEFCARKGDETLDQVIIYFAGHGVSKGKGKDYWLLSKALQRSTEVVDLDATMKEARYSSGIGHIIFISDACRTGVTFEQSGLGEFSVFPPLTRDAQSEYIDRLYSSRPGKPSFEVQVIAEEVAEYRCIYTDCLLDGLKGLLEDEYVEAIVENATRVSVVTPRLLKPYLDVAVPKRVVDLKLQRAQDPDGIIESVLPAFLSRLPARVATNGGGGGGGPMALAPPVSGTEVRLASALGTSLTNPSAPVVLPQEELQIRQVEQDITSTVGRTHYESESGFSVAGAKLVSVSVPPGHTFSMHGDEQVGIEGPAYRLERACSVVLTFDNGLSCVLAALPQYEGTLLFSGGQLVNVAYEPVVNSQRYDEMSGGLPDLAQIRALIAAASMHGAFRVDRDQAPALAETVRRLKRADPTLGLYASYAYDEAGLITSIRDVEGYVRDDLAGTSLYDIAMLGRAASFEPAILDQFTVKPFCPMLSQGWSSLGPKRAVLPPPVVEAGAHRVESFWTLFREPGAAILRDALGTGLIS